MGAIETPSPYVGLIAATRTFIDQHHLSLLSSGNLPLVMQRSESFQLQGVTVSDAIIEGLEASKEDILLARIEASPMMQAMCPLCTYDKELVDTWWSVDTHAPVMYERLQETMRTIARPNSVNSTFVAISLMFEKSKTIVFWCNRIRMAEIFGEDLETLQECKLWVDVNVFGKQRWTDMQPTCRFSQDDVAVPVLTDRQRRMLWNKFLEKRQLHRKENQLWGD